MAQIEDPRWKEPDNKHPADELAEIRLKLREWGAREDELRLLLIDMPKQEREGKRYIATVNEENRKRLNVQALEDELGDLSRFYFDTHFTTVRTKRKKK